VPVTPTGWQQAGAVAEEVAAFKNRLPGVEAKLLPLTSMVGHLAFTVVLVGKRFIGQMTSTDIPDTVDLRWIA
jgi:hypothetical protein